MGVILSMTKHRQNAGVMMGSGNLRFETSITLAITEDLIININYSHQEKGETIITSSPEGTIAYISPVVITGHREVLLAKPYGQEYGYGFGAINQFTNYLHRTILLVDWENPKFVTKYGTVRFIFLSCFLYYI